MFCYEGVLLYDGRRSACTFHLLSAVIDALLRVHLLVLWVLNAWLLVCWMMHYYAPFLCSRRPCSPPLACALGALDACSRCAG